MENFVARPQMTINANKILPNLKHLIYVWCYPDKETKANTEEIQPTFLALTKILSKEIFQAHVVTGLGKKVINESPLLPTLFVINYHIRALTKMKYFPMKNVFN